MPNNIASPINFNCCFMSFPRYADRYPGRQASAYSEDGRRRKQGHGETGHRSRSMQTARQLFET
jgi:hypothetical protein